MEEIDLALIIIFIIIVSIIIGLNIVNVIDTKLDKVKVEVKIPEISINIKQDKEGKYEVKSKIDEQKMESKIVKDVEIEGFSEIENNERIIEKSRIIESKYNEPTKINEHKKEDEVMIQPDGDDEHDYNPIIMNDDAGLKGICPSGGCKKDTTEKKRMVNNSLNKRYIEGVRPLKPFMIEAEIREEIDPADYYRKHYKPPKLHMGDTKMRGSNYGDYTNYIRPEQVDIKLIPGKLRGYRAGEYGRQNIPVASNYIFLDSPSMD
jgi:hypothetical protein